VARFNSCCRRTGPEKNRLSIYKSQELGFVDALLVIRNGKLVAENYYNGYDADKGHQIWSCTKSFMSALVGIAVDIGLIRKCREEYYGLFP